MKFKQISLNEQFEMSFNFLLFILILEGVLLSVEVFSNGYSKKAFFLLGFLLYTRISMGVTIIFFNRKENKQI